MNSIAPAAPPSDARVSYDFSDLPNAALEDEITSLCSHLYAAEYRLLLLIREWSSRGLCGEYGARTPAHWLNYKCGLDMGAAREKVRVAKKLDELPQVSEALAHGEVSYAKVRALTRVATPDNETYLLQMAKASTAAQMEELTRSYKRVRDLNDPELLRRQYRSRELDWHFDDDGMLVIRGRIPPDEGALFVKLMETTMALIREEEYALQSANPVERVHGRVDQADERPVAARRVDALLRLMETGSTAEPAQIPGGERVLVMVHVRADDEAAIDAVEATDAVPDAAATVPSRARADQTGQGDARQAWLEPGPAVPDATARRLACDAARVVYTESGKGEPLAIGRQSRTVPAPMRRALVQRDKGCRFPGCTQRRHVDAHHIVHWSAGGETNIDNLVLLCRHHHRLIHEHGFEVRRNNAGDIEFLDRHGAVMPEAFPLQRVPADGLEATNRQHGLSITADTCNGGYDGAGYDMGLMVDLLHYHTTGETQWKVPVPASGPGPAVSW